MRQREILSSVASKVSTRKPELGASIAAVSIAVPLLVTSLAFGQPPGEPRAFPEAPNASAVPDLPTPAEVDVSQLPSTASTTPPAPPAPPPPPSTALPYVSSSPPPARVPNPEDEEPETLFGGGKDITFGGFGGLSVHYARVLGHDAVWVGGEGAVLLNHAFSFGVGGGGIANEIHPTTEKRLEFGYGGMILRYHFFSSEIVNFAVGGLVGGGSVAVLDRNASHDEVDWEEVSEAVFVAEPEFGLYLNVTRWMRIGVKGGYRFVSGVEKNDLSETDVRGTAGGGALQFGWF